MKLSNKTVLEIALLLCTFVSFSSTIIAQQDFNNFITLKAIGDMPADFTVSTTQKIANDIGTKNQLSKKGEKVFLEGIHYSIDELLHSGLVVYGDEITNYVQKVAHNLLKNDPELKSKLRFYTLKSNATNALSTDQGIVFVTTGLISQLANESQLAYVLAHEIAHYTQHHVVETFDYRNNGKKFHDRILKLSIYSKEKELEADRIGIKMYNQAGYSKDALLSTFDVLLYSYLPFEDIALPTSYFNTDLAYIPENYFSKKAYPVKAEEDKNDANSSHPNIKKRKEAAIKESLNFPDWGSETFVFGEEEFKYIRNISRFESVRTDILDAKFVDALYSIFILEKEYPNSLFLHKMKAHAWLGFAQIAYDNDSKKAISTISDLEGEVAAMHYLFGKLKKADIGVLALRYITDIKNQYPDNAEIKEVWKRIVKTNAAYKDFKLDQFSDKTFALASAEFLKTKSDSASTPKQEETKYERIKRKKDVNQVNNFDSTKFQAYLISDLVASDDFKSTYNGYKNEFESTKKEIDFDSLSRKERNEYFKNMFKSEVHLGISDLIIVEPSARIYSGSSNFDKDKSNKMESKMIACVQEVGEVLDMNLKVINSTNQFVTTTDEFNQRSRIFSYLDQGANNEFGDLLPVDFDDINQIKTMYNTTNVGFLKYTHDYSVRGVYFLSILALVYPAMITYPLIFANGCDASMSLVVIDITNGTVVMRRKEYYKDPNTKGAVKARIYNMMKDLKTKPAPIQ